MADDPHGNPLLLDGPALLAQCDVHIYKASGPGGQHRNKVSSAVRLKHRPTGVSAHGDDSRSQHENKRLALSRLRMKLACQVRHAVDKEGDKPPAPLEECLFAPRGKARSSATSASQRLRIGRKDQRFWTVAGAVLDVLDAQEGKLSNAAAFIGISTGNLVATLKSDRHLLTAAQQIRKAHGQKPVS